MFLKKLELILQIIYKNFIRTPVGLKSMITSIAGKYVQGVGKTCSRHGKMCLLFVRIYVFLSLKYFLLTLITLKHKHKGRGKTRS